MAGNEMKVWQAPIIEAGSRGVQNRIKKPKVGYNASMPQATPDAQSQKQGFDEGFENGYRKGLEKAKQENSEKCAIISTMLEALHTENKNMSSLITNECVALSMTLAQAVIGHEIKQDPEIFKRQIKNYLDALPFSSQALQIIINPECEEILKNLLNSAALQDKTVEIILDENVAVGGVKLRTQFSLVDASIENILREMIPTEQNVKS